MLSLLKTYSRFAAITLVTLAGLTGCMKINDVEPQWASLSMLGLQGSGFGDVVVGASKTLSFEITNIGQTPASGFLVGALAAPFSISNNTCSQNVAPGATCKFDLTFAPT